MGFVGVGSGMMHLALIKNSCSYFMHRQGLVNGGITSSQSIGNFIMTLIADFVLINPNKLGPDKNTGIYPKEIADNFGKSLKYLGIFVGCLFLIGILLSFTYPKDEEENKENNKKENINNNENINENNEELVPNNNNNKPKEAKILLNGFFSLKNLQLGICCYCGLGKYCLINNIK